MRSGLWVSVFVVEAVVKSQQLGHLLGAVALGVLFATLVVTEHRSELTPAQEPLTITAP